MQRLEVVVGLQVQGSTAETRELGLIFEPNWLGVDPRLSFLPCRATGLVSGRMKPSTTVRVRHWGRIRVFCPRRTLSTRPFESSGSCSRRPTAFLALLDEVLASSRLPAGVHGGPEVAVVDLADASPEVVAQVA